MTILYCLKKHKSLYFQRFSDFNSFLKRFNLHVEVAEKLYFLYVLEQLFIFCLVCRQEEKRTRYSISYASCFTSDVLLFTRPESGHVLVLWWSSKTRPHNIARCLYFADTFCKCPFWESDLLYLNFAESGKCRDRFSSLWMMESWIWLPSYLRYSYPGS